MPHSSSPVSGRPEARSGYPVLSRRRLLGLGGSAAALTLVPACASGSGGARDVGWQAIPPYSLQAPDPKRAAYLKRRLSAYRRGSSYDVTPLVSSNDNAAAMAKLLLQASQGRAPDIAQVDAYVFGRMARYAQPLQPHLSRLGLDPDDWFPSLRRSMGAGGPGGVRGLQFTSDVRVLYHRRDLVPEPPGDWDEMIRMARPLARRGHSVLFPGGRSEGAVTTTLWPAYWSQGAELFDASGEPAFASGRGYAAMLAALEAVQRAVESGVTPPRVAGFELEDDQNPDVAAGRVAMFLGGSWQASALDDLMKDENFFRRWGVAPLPVVGGGRPVSATGGWMWAAFTEDEEKLAAGLDWIDSAYTGDRGMASWCSLGGYLPPRRSVYGREDFSGNPFTPVFRDHLARYGRSRPDDRKYQDVSHTLQIALSGVASGTVGAAQALDQALDRLV